MVRDWNTQAESEMAINKTEWEHIGRIVSDEVAKHSRGKLSQLKSWSPLGAAVAIGLFVLLQWNSYTVFRTHTEDKLQDIDAKLLNLSPGSSPRKTLADIGALRPRALAEALPALRTVSQQAPATVNPDPKILKDIGYSLAKVKETTPDYWPTVLQYISFASSGLYTNVPAKGAKVFAEIGAGSRDNSFGTMYNKVFEIDGSGSIINTTFVNCRIVLHGPEEFRNVTFINTIIEFDFPEPDSDPSVQRLVMAMLV